MFRIIPFDKNRHFNDIVKVIAGSFITVATEFSLTRENAPTNPAFATPESLAEYLEKDVEIFLAENGREIVGCIAIEKSHIDGISLFIERLGVLPEFRHRGIGRKLLDRALEEIKSRGGKSAGIGIINENTVLKNWYINCGFRETGTKVFQHLPFTVCFMKIDL